MEKQYEELLKMFKELEEGMTQETLKKLTPEQLCYMIDEIAEIKGKIAVLKNEE